MYSSPIDCFYDSIEMFVLNFYQLKEYGFPIVENCSVTIKPNQYQLGKQMYYQPDDRLRQCLRCNYTFMVDKLGHQTLHDLVVCDSANGLFNYHIHDQQPVENLLKFTRTRRSLYQSGSVFALDVEMVYTTKGQEVGRVTLVDYQGQTLIDSIVLPENPVIDYVTKYSGLTKESFDGVTTTFDQVKSELVKYIDKDSILVGHGLNGDLRALRLIHPNIIDTSIMFMEGSKRPSLKDLTSEYLGLSIQQDPNGHCSEEDAVAALKLVYHVAMGSHQEQKEVDQHAQCMQLAQQLFNHQLVYSR